MSRNPSISITFTANKYAVKSGEAIIGYKTDITLIGSNGVEVDLSFKSAKDTMDAAKWDYDTMFVWDNGSTLDKASFLARLAAIEERERVKKVYKLTDYLPVIRSLTQYARNTETNAPVSFDKIPASGSSLFTTYIPNGDKKRCLVDYSVKDTEDTKVAATLALVAWANGNADRMLLFAQWVQLGSNVVKIAIEGHLSCDKRLKDMFTLPVNL